MITIGHILFVSGVLIKLDINTFRYIPILARFSFGSIAIVEGLLDVIQIEVWTEVCTLHVHPMVTRGGATRAMKRIKRHIEHKIHVVVIYIIILLQALK